VGITSEEDISRATGLSKRRVREIKSSRVKKETGIEGFGHNLTLFNAEK